MSSGVELFLNNCSFHLLIWSFCFAMAAYCDSIKFKPEYSLNSFLIMWITNKLFVRILLLLHLMKKCLIWFHYLITTFFQFWLRIKDSMTWSLVQNDVIHHILVWYREVFHQHAGYFFCEAFWIFFLWIGSFAYEVICIFYMWHKSYIFLVTSSIIKKIGVIFWNETSLIVIESWWNSSDLPSEISPVTIKTTTVLPEFDQICK